MSLPRPTYTSKTLWTTQRDVFLLEELLKATHAGHRNEVGFTKEGWRLITRAFNERFLTNLEKSHIKNHVQILKRTFDAWMKLKSTEGVRWNPDTMVYEATEEVWDRFIAAYPHGRHFRTRSFFYEDQMRNIYPKLPSPPQERDNIDMHTDLLFHDEPRRPLKRPRTENVVVDADALAAAVKLVAESMKSLPQATSPTRPSSPQSANAISANTRFQAAVKLLGRMRRDSGWTKDQYKHALAVLRQLDETGVIMLLEMDEDAREDFILSDF